MSGVPKDDDFHVKGELQISESGECLFLWSWVPDVGGGEISVERRGRDSIALRAEIILWKI